MNLNGNSGNVGRVLQNKNPSGIVFAPNYWQWFSHHQNHGILPDEIKHCETQLDMINWLGLDVFSRNIYCKQDEYWFGGICEELFDGVEVNKTSYIENGDKITNKEYHFGTGVLTEQLRYVFSESTIVQKKFLISDYSKEARLLEQLLASRKWKFNPLKFEAIRNKVGDNGVVVVGDFFSPLKMLHIVMNPVQSVYFLMEQPDFAKSLLDIHEHAQLDLVTQCVSQGVKVVMSMDNLDTMFHPPDYVEAYSASFYEKASAICHAYGAKFFIHACGNQKENLPLIASYGVDGLEGVAYPPLGNVELDEAMRMTPEHFIITGGISAIETRDLKSREEVFSYVKNLFHKMTPYKNRFMFSASCNTPIDTKWETIKNFRDAWLEYKDC
jgi:uroporphyrinogen-III decarboxylase